MVERYDRGWAQLNYGDEGVIYGWSNQKFFIKLARWIEKNSTHRFYIRQRDASESESYSDGEADEEGEETDEKDFNPYDIEDFIGNDYCITQYEQYLHSTFLLLF